MFEALGDDGQYHANKRSIAFAGLASTDLQGFVDRRGTIGEDALEEDLRQFVRTPLKKMAP